MVKAGRVWLAAVVLGLACWALAAAGAAAAERITIELVDYAYVPGTITLKAGTEYQLVLVNHASQEHEFLVGKGRVTQGDEESFRENFFEDIDVNLTVGGVTIGTTDLEEIELEPNGQVTLDFTVPADRRGDWEMACFIPGHYDLGMHGTVKVQ